MKIYVLIVVILLFITSCSEDKRAPYSPPENISELLAGDTLKIWKLAKRYNGKTRMNMGDCFLNYRQTFYGSGSVSDSNGDQSDCGPSLRGQWNIVLDSVGAAYLRITSDQIPSLMGIEENYKDFRIFYASKDSLHLSYTHKQFGEQRRISDYLVREEVEVLDRDFHFD